MEVEANEEVQQWAAAQEVSDLLPRLSEAGFITMVSVRLIDTNDFAPMGIAKPGDQKRLLSAVQQAIKEASGPDVRMVHEEVQELRSDFKKLAIKVAKDRSERSTPSTFSDHYDQLHKAQAPEAWFSVATQRPMVPARGRGGRAMKEYLFPESGHPAAGAHEIRVVQPYWSEKLKKLPRQGRPGCRSRGHPSVGVIRQPQACDITIDKEPVVMGPLLGVGGSSVVYSGMHQGAEVVVKRFNSTYKLYHLQQEAAILRKIESVVPRVPRLIARDDQGLVLLLQPVGVQFASRLSHFDPQKETTIQRVVATADDFCQLVDILQTVHGQHNFVHRDVRLPNFFRDQESGMVFLNDWGCATEVGNSVTRERCSTLRFVCSNAGDRKAPTSHGLAMTSRCWCGASSTAFR